MNVRPAGTVMLVRSAPGGVELFMLRRSSASTFAPDVYVFPGGTVDPQDRDDATRAQPGIEPARLRHLFRMSDPPEPRLQASLLLAAMRELFEETSVRISDVRSLELFSRWITPQSVAPRYDVYFFVAPLPDGQSAVADAVETHDGIWITPADALARSDAGELSIIYPTRKHLERLRDFTSVAELLAFARSKPIRTIVAEGNERSGFSLPNEFEDAW